MTRCDVAIIGAGPYGLSAAAHLAHIEGLDVRVFGDPMTFWSRNMPAGMFLRSNWTATQIASPRSSLTLEAYQGSTGGRVSVPVPLEDFVRYGVWYQQKAVPGLDRRKVTKIERDAKGFRVILESGEDVVATRVIVAAGIGSFIRRPSEFDNIPDSLASHTSAHSDMRRFAGKRVLVIGSGQSALESGALLRETGADVEIVGRANQIHWLQGSLSKFLHHGAGRFMRSLLYAPTDVGPAGLSQLMARPRLLGLVPRRVQDALRKRCVRPAGARWLVARLKDVPLRLGRTVAVASVSGDRVKVRLDDGSEGVYDHVLLGTGYKIDVSRYEFLSPDLIAGIDRVNGFPRLKAGLETSVPGLHILGAPGAWSFGPLMQFVSGTTFASGELTRCIARSKSTRV